MVRSFSQHLKEAGTLMETRKGYEQMIAPIIAMLKDVKATYSRSLDQTLIDGALESATGIADAYRTKLLRNDRIVWALKWYRLETISRWLPLLRGFLGQTEERAPQQFAVWKQHFDRLEKIYVKDLTTFTNGEQKNSRENVEYAIERSYTYIEFLCSHYMSYMKSQTDRNYIARMDAVVFKDQLPIYIDHLFRDIENKWKEERKQVIDHAEDYYEDAEKLIDFGDGWAWWDLGVPECDLEGSSMGHCGNTAASKSDDRVLSLRREVVKNGVRLHRPSLTFVLHKDGYLGEMKGRGNKKPAPEYHPYIIALLKHPRIEGIRGGGHAPDQNFSLYDLDQNARKELTDEKPALKTVADWYNEEGATDRVLNAAIIELSNRGLPHRGVELFNDRSVSVEHWPSVSALSRSFNWEVLDELAKYLDEFDEGDTDHLHYVLSEQDANEVLEFLPDQYLSLLAKDLGLDGTVGDIRFRRTIAAHLSWHGGRYRGVMEKAIKKSGSGFRDDPDLPAYIRLVVETLSSGLTIHQAGFVLSPDETGLDGTVNLVLDFTSLINIISASEGDDDEYGLSFLTLLETGDWSHMDYDDNIVERWNEEDSPLKEKFYERIKAAAKSVDNRKVSDQEEKWRIQGNSLPKASSRLSDYDDVDSIRKEDRASDMTSINPRVAAYEFVRLIDHDASDREIDQIRRLAGL